MKKMIILLLTLIVFSNTCLAYSDRIEMFAEAIASNTHNSSQAKFYKISGWVENSIQYQFYHHARGLDITWDELKGDCTDKAMLKQYMLGKINVTSRLVHGYDYFNIKHDTLEYFYNDTWNQYEFGFSKEGNGIW